MHATTTRRRGIQTLGANVFLNYYLNDPFKESGQALYYWSPIADELKSLDKKIVLNSIHLKWGLMKDEFKKLTKDLKLINLYFVYSLQETLLH